MHYGDVSHKLVLPFEGYYALFWNRKTYAYADGMLTTCLLFNIDFTGIAISMGFYYQISVMTT